MYAIILLIERTNSSPIQLNSLSELLPDEVENRLSFSCLYGTRQSGSALWCQINSSTTIYLKVMIRGCNVMKILVTGGAGFIGSHTIIELINSDHSVVVVDNLINSCRESLHRVENLTSISIPFFHIDIRDREKLEAIFEEYTFDCVIHFAELKSVGESVIKPWEYYSNNLTGTLVLVDVMRKYGCKNIIFSSSATVYGNSPVMPITEDCPKGKCTNPYGQTKSMLEEILMDLYTADVKTNDPNPWNIVLLRYFNPIGAHPSG